MNIVKKFTTVHFRLNQIDAVEFVEVNDLSNKVCVPTKTEYLNISVFNMIIGLNESKTLSECKCKFYGRSCNSDQWWNNDK